MSKKQVAGAAAAIVALVGGYLGAPAAHAVEGCTAGSPSTVLGQSVNGVGSSCSYVATVEGGWVATADAFVVEIDRAFVDTDGDGVVDEGEFSTDETYDDPVGHSVGETGIIQPGDAVRVVVHGVGQITVGSPV